MKGGFLGDTPNPARRCALDSPSLGALFQPIRFGSVTARNRIVMAPMVTNFANPDDTVSDRLVAYHTERAKGGVGTIVVESSPVRQYARSGVRRVGAHDDRFIPGLERLAGGIKSQGAVALIQITHSGPRARPPAGFPLESVSDVRIRGGDEPLKVLDAADLRQVRREFVAAARRGQKAGFDGVDLHSGHFYLLGAAISPFTNDRTDEYGGSTANRARLTREIVDEIKAELGREFLVWVRMNAREALEPGLSEEEGQEVAGILAGAGADVIDVSAYILPIKPELAANRRMKLSGIPQKSAPPGVFLECAAAIKRAVHVPVVAVGKLDDPALAAHALVEGKADLVALGRQMLCDPYWPRKVQSGQAERIVHCNYCGACDTLEQRNVDIRCTRNLNLCGEPRYPRAHAHKP